MTVKWSRKYSREKIIEACALHLIGTPVKEIERRTGLVPSMVAYHLRRCGHFKTRTKRRRQVRCRDLSALLSRHPDLEVTQKENAREDVTGVSTIFGVALLCDEKNCPSPTGDHCLECGEGCRMIYLVIKNRRVTWVESEDMRSSRQRHNTYEFANPAGGVRTRWIRRGDSIHPLNDALRA